MALGKARGMQPPRREDADEKQPMGIGWKDGDAVGPAGAGDARPQDGGIQRVSRDGEMRGGGRNPEKMEPVGRTHVQRVLRRLRLRAAVEADEADGLQRKERRHHQSRWRGAEGGPPTPGTGDAGGGWEFGVGCLPHFEQLLPVWR